MTQYQGTLRVAALDPAMASSVKNTLSNWRSQNDGERNPATNQYKGLVSFIADLRAARARELEEKRINRELANIRFVSYVHGCGPLY